MAAATAEMTVGRVTPKDLKVPLALASAAKAKDLVVRADCSLEFATSDLRARVPFAGRPWDGDAECRVSRQAFARVVRACRSADLLLEPSETGLVITAGALTVTLPYAVPTVSELAEQEAGDELLSIEARALARGLLRAEPFAARDETRPLLCSVALDLGRGKAVATDSYRLTVVDVPDLARLVSEVLLLPLAAVRPLAQVLASHAGDVTLSLARDDKVLLVAVGDQEWSLRLRDGNYPEWPDLIAEGDATEIEVDAAELADVASLITDTYAITGYSTSHAPLVLAATQGKVTVQTRHPECIEVRQEIAATGTVREPVEIGFNPRFLADAMRAIAPDRAKLTLLSPLRPMVAAAPDALVLVMPVRLNV